jgi:hypothetical protein
LQSSSADLRAENASLRERLDALEGIVAAIATVPLCAGASLPLFKHAVKSGNHSMVKYLLRQGVKPDLTCDEYIYQNSETRSGNIYHSFPSLHQAAFEGDAEMVELLLENGASNLINQSVGISVVESDMKAFSTPLKNWLQASICRCGNNQRGGTGCRCGVQSRSCGRDQGRSEFIMVTPLQLAVFAASLPVVELLVAHRPTVSTRCNDGKTDGLPFYVPANSADGDAVALFLMPHLQADQSEVSGSQIRLNRF